MFNKVHKNLIPSVILPALALALVYLFVIHTFGHNAYYMKILTLALIHCILAVSLNLTYGFTGQFSLGHAGFMAVGAYVSGVLTVFAQWPFLPSLLLGSLAAALAGIVIGLPTLRLRGDYLGIATLGFAEIIRITIINLEVVGGPRGLTGLYPYTTFTWAYGAAVFTVIIIKNFILSSHGRACIAIREDEIAAEAMGINTTGYKVTAFCLGATFAGLAGGLFGHWLMFLHPSSYGFMKSVDYLVMVVLGGTGSLTGSILAALFLTLVSESLRRFVELRMLIYAILLILLMLTRPQGLLGGKEFSWTKVPLVKMPALFTRVKVGGRRRDTT